MVSEIQLEQSKQRKNVTWTDRMDNVLITALFEEALKGGKNKDNTWKSETLKRAARSVEKVSHCTLNNENIRSRLKTLRRHWLIVHEAASQSGFNFNYTTNLVEADDISWAGYIESHPNAANIRDKPMKYYSELSQLFSKDAATGEPQFVGDDQPSPRARKNGPTSAGLNEDGLIHLYPSSDPFSDANISNAEAMASSDTPPLHNSKRGGSGLGSSKQGKKARRGTTNDEVMLSTCKALESAAKEISRCFKGPDYATLDDEIEAVSGLTQAQVTQALELFSENKKWVPLFLGMKKARRGDWIRGKLGILTGPE